MKKMILAAVALGLILVCVAVSQTPAAPKHRVIFQLTEPEGREWNLLSIHVNNFREAFAKDGGSEIQVIFFGPALNLFRNTNPTHAEPIKQPVATGLPLPVES
jgi:intracellular sulfur oxidation DsrE/DsrF family protein